MKKYFRFLEKSEASSALIYVGRAIKLVYMILGILAWVAVFFGSFVETQANPLSVIFIGFIFGGFLCVLIIFFGLVLEALFVGIGVLVENSNDAKEDRKRNNKEKEEKPLNQTQELV